MRIGQPIYWDNEDGRQIGIVADIIPAKGGVIAYTDPKNPSAKAKVKNPHKVMGPDLPKIIQAFAALPEVGKWFEESTGQPLPGTEEMESALSAKKAKAKAAKATEPPSPVMLDVVYEKALAELNKPLTIADLLGRPMDTGDWIRIHGLLGGVEDMLPKV